MGPFNNLQVQNNLNVYDAELFREIEFTFFQEELLPKTVAAMISEMEMNKFGAIIRAPQFDRSKIVVSVDDAYQCTVTQNSTLETSSETFTIDKTLSSAFDVCPWDEAYQTMNITAEGNKVMNEQMLFAIDTYVLGQALAQATNTLTAIVDDATAQTAVTEANTYFAGLAATPGSKVIVAPNTMYSFFQDLFIDRMTIVGDNVLLTGNLETIGGWTIAFVDASIHPDPTKVIFAVGKPLVTYIDELGYNEEWRYVESGDPTITNRNKRYFRQLNIGTKIWSSKQSQIHIAG